MTHTPPARGTGLAYVRFGEPDQGGRRAFRAYAVPPERDGERVDVPTGPRDDPFEGVHDLFYEVTIDGRTGALRFSLVAPIAPDSPEMWFVAVDAERSFGPALRSMVAFATDRFADGTIIDEMQFVSLGIDNSTQVGAVIWSRDSGVVSQLYVAPDHRRSDVARRVLFSAGAFHHAHGWPGVIRSDGRRTELGQQYALSAILSQRIAPHTELSPPMDPD